MLWDKKTPEEKATREVARQKELEAREIERREAEANRMAQQFAKTPAGQARAARNAGARIFQLALPLSTTVGHIVSLVGAFTKKTDKAQHGSVLDSIEAEGWSLEHVGYVFRATGSVSRDKFLASGQQEAISGEIIGIYLFRRRD